MAAAASSPDFIDGELEVIRLSSLTLVDFVASCNAKLIESASFAKLKAKTSV